MNGLPPFDTSTRIGLVGLGIMGAPIAQRLLAKGYAVTVWNLEPERYDLVAGAGATWAESPAAVWEASDLVMVCVLGDDAIESVCTGEIGFTRAAAGASVLVDLSTTSPAATAALAPRMLSERGAQWIDCPMSGGPGAAADGTLTLMAGGDAGVFAAVEPVLRAIAGNVTLMGGLGAGQVTKVLNQAIVGVNYILMAELLTTAKAAGVEPTLLPDCLKGGMADSTILQRIYTQMAHNDFDPPRSYARQVNKDLKSVVGFLEELGLDMPLIELSVARYRSWAEDGNLMEDGGAVSRLYGN
ncbi:MAG: NAD(P)-dependent oxidoreductase [Pseudomonadota bacterium]